MNVIRIDYHCRIIKLLPGTYIPALRSTSRCFQYKINGIELFQSGPRHSLGLAFSLLFQQPVFRTLIENPLSQLVGVGRWRWHMSILLLELNERVEQVFPPTIIGLMPNDPLTSNIIESVNVLWCHCV
jgi:hypothetical protein